MGRLDILMSHEFQLHTIVLPPQLTVATFLRRFPHRRPVDTVIVPAPNNNLERADKTESINLTPLIMTAMVNLNLQDPSYAQDAAIPFFIIILPMRPVSSTDLRRSSQAAASRRTPD